MIFFFFWQLWLGIRSNHVTLSVCKANCYAPKRTAILQAPPPTFVISSILFVFFQVENYYGYWPRIIQGWYHTMMVRNEENVCMVDDRNHWSQKLMAILFKPIKLAKKRGEEKSLHIGWVNESLWRWDHSDAQS